MPAGSRALTAVTTARNSVSPSAPPASGSASVTYTYSALRGNYSGLTNTEPTDGGTSGRLAPNNSRLFDLPTMTYLPSGKIDDGPLATDRPNTGKAFGFYRLKSKLGDHHCWA